MLADWKLSIYQSIYLSINHVHKCKETVSKIHDRTPRKIQIFTYWWLEIIIIVGPGNPTSMASYVPTTPDLRQLQFDGMAKPLPLQRRSRPMSRCRPVHWSSHQPSAVAGRAQEGSLTSRLPSVPEVTVRASGL